MSEPTGTLYRILLFLHVTCIVGGFGGLAWNWRYVAGARRRLAEGSLGAIEANTRVSQIPEYLVYAALIFGGAVVGASKVHGKLYWDFKQGWLSAGTALYVVALGMLHGLIRPSQKKFAAAASALAGTSPSPGAGAPPEVARLESLERRINLGWGSFNLIVLVVLWLMLFTPGH